MKKTDWNTGQLTSWPPKAEESPMEKKTKTVTTKVTDWNTGEQTDWHRLATDDKE
jgi:hypothetical protein